MSQEILLPTLHPAQRQIVAEARRFSTLACGRRWGKTTLGIDRALHTALKGKPVGWFAPSYRHLMDVWRQLEGIIGHVSESNRNEKFISLPGGGSIEFWSLDSSAPARGRKYATVIVDEAAFAPDLQNQFEGAIRPTLTDYGGDAWFLSTPFGMNYFHTLWQRGQDLERGDWASWTRPTATNTTIENLESEIAGVKLELSEARFRAEYLAEFISLEGAIFRGIERAVWSPPDYLQSANFGVPSWRGWNPSTNIPGFAIGVDWGRTQDFSVFTVGTDVPFEPTGEDIAGVGEDAGTAEQATLGPMVSVVAIDRFRGISYPLQQSRLRALWERFGRPPIVAEANSIGMPVIEQLRRDGIPVKPFTTTNTSKAAVVDALALSFERGRIRIPGDAALVNELTAFESTRLPSGLMRYAAPSGSHDDMVVSLALAHYAVSRYAGQNNPHQRQRKKDAILTAMGNGMSY